MLTTVDEYPVHQITDTFATVLSGDKHWNDGHYICLCDDAGEVSLVSTVRLYQNNDVLDGFVCIRHEGMQHNIRVSRRLRPDIDHYGAGLYEICRHHGKPANGRHDDIGLLRDRSEIPGP